MRSLGLIADLRKLFQSRSFIKSVRIPASWFWKIKIIIVYLSIEWSKLEFSSSRHVFCQDWHKFAKWIGERQFFLMSSKYFRHSFAIISSWKRTGPYSFEQTWNPFTQGCFVKSLQWIKLAPWSRRRGWKCDKFTDRQTTDNRRKKSSPDGNRTAELNCQA